MPEVNLSKPNVKGEFKSSGFTDELIHDGKTYFNCKLTTPTCDFCDLHTKVIMWLGLKSGITGKNAFSEGLILWFIIS